MGCAHGYYKPPLRGSEIECVRLKPALAPVEFGDSTNARESGGRFIGGSLGRDQLEQDFQTLLAGQGMVVGAIGGLGGGVGCEFSNYLLHSSIISARGAGRNESG